jgi:hypothetical protein
MRHWHPAFIKDFSKANLDFFPLSYLLPPPYTLSKLSQLYLSEKKKPSEGKASYFSNTKSPNPPHLYTLASFPVL